MIENGFDDRPSDPEGALEIYRQAHKLGNADALINIALYYIRGKQPVETDTKKGKEILKQAYKIGSTVSKDTVLDYMIGFGFIKNKKEMEIEMLNMDEEVVSWMA
jgi:TPR repeat protein